MQSLPPSARAAEPVLPMVRWLPLAMVAVFYVVACFGPAVFNQNEAQYAGAAREMLNRPQDYQASARRQSERGQWLVPTNDGVPRLQKPPLVYWLLIASMQAFGVNEFSARLPNALASLAWFAGVLMLGRRLVSDRRAGLQLGFAAATILATMAGTFIFSHLIAPEPFLAALLTWTFWCLLSACREPARAGGFFTLAWLLMGLGAMSKGLHAVLYPLAVVGLLAWRHPRTRPVWRQMFRPAGGLILLAVMVPWYAYIEHKYPGFLWDQFVNEQWGHVINHRFPPDSLTVPLPVFALEHLVLFLPWTFFIPAAYMSRRWSARPGDWDLLGKEMLGGWFGVTFLSLIFSSLQDYYLLTAFGTVAFWLARPWVNVSGKDNRVAAWTVFAPGVALATMGALICAAGIYLQSRGGVPDGTATNTDTERDQIWATVAGFSVDAWKHLLPLLWTAGAIFLAGGGVAAFFGKRGNRPAVLATMAVMMVAMLGVALRGMCVLEDYFSLKNVCLFINRTAPPAAAVVRYGPTFGSPSLLFYLDREVYWLGANPDGEFASRRLGINRQQFWSNDDFLKRWSGEAAVLLCIEDSDLKNLRATVPFSASQLEPIARFGTTQLLGNHGMPAPGAWPAGRAF